jgi:hypothetical protein
LIIAIELKGGLADLESRLEAAERELSKRQAEEGDVLVKAADYAELKRERDEARERLKKVRLVCNMLLGIGFTAADRLKDKLVEVERLATEAEGEGDGT